MAAGLFGVIQAAASPCGAAAAGPGGMPGPFAEAVCRVAMNAVLRDCALTTCGAHIAALPELDCLGQLLASYSSRVCEQGGSRMVSAPRALPHSSRTKRGARRARACPLARRVLVVAQRALRWAWPPSQLAGGEGNINLVSLPALEIQNFCLR